MNLDALKLRTYRLLRKPFDDSVSFTLEITTRCNLGCRFCTHGFRGDKDMSLGLVEDSLDYFQRLISEYGIKRYSVTPVGVGEPTLHPDFFEILDLIHGRLPDARILLNTNLYGKNEMFFSRLIGSPVDVVCVSLRFSDPVSYRLECGVDGWDYVVGSLRRLAGLNVDGKELHCQLFTGQPRIVFPGVKTIFESRIDFGDRERVIRLIHGSRGQVVVSVDGRVFPSCLCVWLDGMDEFEDKVSLVKGWNE